jgi:superfamily II DNA helicase RecQ
MKLSLNSFFHSILYALERCKFEDVFLKAQQYKILDAITSEKDVICVLPTGYGKSIIFQLLPYVYEYHLEKESIVLVVAPLNAIIDDQIQNLRKRGLSVGALKTDEENSMGTSKKQKT